jgi:hypothetical protein
MSEIPLKNRPFFAAPVFTRLHPSFTVSFAAMGKLYGMGVEADDNAAA